MSFSMKNQIKVLAICFIVLSGLCMLTMLKADRLYDEIIARTPRKPVASGQVAIYHPPK
jgi:hypothetical protein